MSSCPTNRRTGLSSLSHGSERASDHSHTAANTPTMAPSSCLTQEVEVHPIRPGRSNVVARQQRPSTMVLSALAGAGVRLHALVRRAVERPNPQSPDEHSAGGASV